MVKLRKVRKEILLIIFFCILLFFIPFRAVFAFSNDINFGTNGKTITSFGHDATIQKAELQSDGKIVVVGNYSNGNNLDWAIVRYNTSGSLDNTFGTNGIVAQDFNSLNDSIHSVAIQSDGKIVVGGYSGPGFTWTLARYNSNGSLDTSFGQNGLIRSIQGIVMDLKIQQDKKIVTIGYGVGITNGHDDVVVTRYNPDGSLDTGFGANGTIIASIGPTNDRGVVGAIQTDGKIIVFGDFDAGGRDETFIERYNTNGTLDSTFGNSGKVLTQYELSSGARDMLLQRNGKIIVTGATVNGKLDTFLSRYNPDGTLDSSFGNNGKVIISFSPVDDVSQSLVVQSDDKVVIGGYEDTESSTGVDFVFRRFESNGTLDSSFGNSGSFVFPIGQGYDQLQSIVLQNDGRVITAGFTSNGSYYDWVVARFFNFSGISLNVPPLKQTDPLWADNVYDNANLWSTGTTDIGRWGCAVTSAAMVLQYNKINTLPNEQPLTPGTLNSWLKSMPDGYIRNGLVNWLAISRTSRLSKINNPDFDFDGLEYARVSHQDDTQLRADIDSGLPAIVEEPGHFVVAKGINDETFNINDPYYDRSTLADYGNAYNSYGKYTPSNTDLSYLMFVVDPTVNIILKDSQGNQVGDAFTENPIGDPLNTLNNTNGPLKMIILSKPPTGKYTIEVTSTNPTSYFLQGYLYDSNGNIRMVDKKDVLSSNDADSFTIDYDNSDLSEVSLNENVTFNILGNDIEVLYSFGHIDKQFYKELNNKVNEIEKTREKNNKSIENKLEELYKEIGKKKGTDSYATTILLNDVRVLINSLSS